MTILRVRSGVTASTSWWIVQDYPYNRLLAFARKSAPVQVAYPNYPGATGLSAFDAILTDEWTTPGVPSTSTWNPCGVCPPGT